jgi:DNA-3-methyladenine glycosylase
VIVETEAYAEHGDEACHTASRPSARAFIRDHDAGAAYVYFNLNTAIGTTDYTEYTDFE